MVSYTQNELLSITDFTKSISKILGNLKEHSLEKVGILKNNKLEAVVISTQEYERLKEIEELMNNIEHKELKINTERTAQMGDNVWFAQTFLNQGFLDEKNEEINSAVEWFQKSYQQGKETGESAITNLAADKYNELIDIIQNTASSDLDRPSSAP